jgi:hypothetical protein
MQNRIPAGPIMEKEYFMDYVDAVNAGGGGYGIEITDFGVLTYR